MADWHEEERKLEAQRQRHRMELASKRAKERELHDKRMREIAEERQQHEWRLEQERQRYEEEKEEERQKFEEEMEAERAANEQKVAEQYRLAQLEANSKCINNKGKKLPGVYVGEERNGLAWGKGVFYHDNGCRYEGNFEGGAYSGYGRFYLFDEGLEYEGNWKNGIKDGEGIFHYFATKRKEYRGTYVLGKREGNGTLIWRDGTQYEGTFLNDKMNGYGVMTWPDGSRYEGEYKDGVRHGKGIYYFTNGNTFEGEWVNNNRLKGIISRPDSTSFEGEWSGRKIINGEGTLKWDNGDFFTGKYIDGKKTGVGRETLSNGEIYEGELKDDVRTGQGIYHYANGDIYEGKFKDDIRSGYGIYRYANGDIYEGEWKDNIRCGKGTLKSVNGDIYTGQWKKDTFNGDGVYEYSNGCKFEGDWKNGEYSHGTYFYADGSSLYALWDKKMFSTTSYYQSINGDIYKISTFKSGKKVLYIGVSETHYIYCNGNIKSGFKIEEFPEIGYATFTLGKETRYYYSDKNQDVEWCSGAQAPPANLWEDKSQCKTGASKAITTLHQQFFGPTMRGTFSYRNGDIFEGVICCGKPVRKDEIFLTKAVKLCTYGPLLAIFKFYAWIFKNVKNSIRK